MRSTSASFTSRSQNTTRPNAFPARMVSLSILPAELIFQIFENLNNEDSILALRMTCKRLSVLGEDIYRDLIYNTRTVYPVPASFDNLLEISKSKMNTRVQHLKFSALSPYMRGETAFFTGNPEGMAISEMLDVTDKPSDYVDEVRKATELEIQRITSHCTPRGHTYLSKITREIFPNLPNLKSICFTGRKIDGPLTRSYVNIFYPGLSRRKLPGYLSEHFFTSGPVSFLCEELTEHVIPAALMAGLPHLETIKGFHRGAIPTGFLDELELECINPKLPVSNNLRVLHIRLNTTPPYDPDMGLTDPSATRGIIPFCDWIRSNGSQLRELYLTATESESIPTFAGSIPTGLPKLKRLRLDSATIGAADWKKLIVTSPELEEVTLLGCYLDDPIFMSFPRLEYPYQNHRGELILGILKIDRNMPQTESLVGPGDEKLFPQEDRVLEGIICTLTTSVTIGGQFRQDNADIDAPIIVTKAPWTEEERLMITILSNGGWVFSRIARAMPWRSRRWVMREVRSLNKDRRRPYIFVPSKW
ncbi:hypothetical protein TWF730_005377 [Orbilia blumenaviensis]|uniref:F-box domain-containing protein n=1 Tax=Orbilia blumenaviensis TaxID=1796055 RepID=A0AAV9VI71_9PEZI